MRKTVYFLLLFFSLSGLLSLCFHQMMKGSQLIFSDSQIKDVGTEIDYLIAGTSHVLAIQEQEIPNALNIGTFAEAIHQTYYKLDYLLTNKGTEVENVIFSYDLGLLKTHEVDNQSYQYYWNRYENVSELIKFSTNKLDFIANRVASFLFPYKDGEVDAFDYLFAAKDSNELAKLRDGVKIQSLNPKAKRERNDQCLSGQFSAYGIYYFSKIIDLCQTKNIRLYLVRFPVTARFYFDQSTCFLPNEYYEKINKLYLQNKQNVVVLDFHDLYDESKFRDPHHLKGGQIRSDFTHELIDEINELRRISK